MSAVRRLTVADVPAALDLSTSAGWNQTEADWLRALELEPEGCFAIDGAGRLAATTTAIRFGSDMAWIGMVLTAPQFRRQGFARRLLLHALEFLRGCRVPVARLDATAMGRPLYSSLGFIDECPVERWSLTAARLPPGRAAGARVETHFSLPVIDLAAFGCDRFPLLMSLARPPSGEPGGPSPESEDAGSLPEQGYALGRPGARAAYFGPCVARTPESARELLAWFLARHAGEPVFWDLLPENRDAVALAGEFGFRRDRQLVRMLRREAPDAAAPRIDTRLTYAIAGFEYG